MAAYPWFGSVGLLLLVWLLRSGSLAASAAGERRRLRGRKWYDGAQFLLRTPWDLVRSIPVTVMLLLWSAGLAVAAALLCYAFVAGEAVTLFVCGAIFAVAVWTGPGRLPGALAALPGGQPAVAGVEAVGRGARPSPWSSRPRRRARSPSSGAPVDARAGPSAVG